VICQLHYTSLLKYLNNFNCRHSNINTYKQIFSRPETVPNAIVKIQFGLLIKSKMTAYETPNEKQVLLVKLFEE